MKTRYKKVKRTREEIINDKWLKIHITAHRITKSKDNNEIEKMRKSNRQTLKSINRLKSLMQGGKANGKNKS
jgi:Xaa-Pro aminopeptidase